MTVEVLHPDHLQPGHMVGPWLIVQVLGRGGSARVFKVERDGKPYSMKMGLLPLSKAREGLSELVTAIATVPPKAPHLLNPLAPRALSDISMRLLEKKPEERYPSAEALLRALDQAAEDERRTPAWRVPLFEAEQGPVEPTPKEELAPPAQSPETARAAPTEAQPPKEEERKVPEPQETPAAPGHPRRPRWPWVLFAGLTLLGLALWLAHSTIAPPPEALLPGSGHSEKGSPPVSTTLSSTSSSFLAAWLCAVIGIGCPGAQVKPPEPEDCPKEATEAMFQELKVHEASRLRAVVDINQPGDTSEAGFYQDGPVIGRLVEGDGNLPEGTLLHGRLWTGPGIYDIAYKMDERVERPAIQGRYTLAVLPDGRKYPVCIVLGADDGRVPKEKGSKPGAAIIAREMVVSVVQRWP